ncbi:MAG: cytochrome c peroxidase [Planctomycetota bacterium]|nr:cytochrome c peroxidase [Planctomycetota bacterium]MDG1983754.1 cytochrome c peroxidase [Planctomycetota bacterium]
MRFPIATIALFAAVPTLAAAQSLPAPPAPPENPITEQKRILGKALFWDEQLSSDNTVACGTCHIPSAGGSDPRVDMGSRHPGLNGVFGDSDDRFGSGGVRLADSSGNLSPDATFGFSPQVTGRRSPSPIGAAFFNELFWDGRATSTFINPETGQVSIPSGGALESQAVGPILSFVEMADAGRTWADVTGKLEQVQPLALAANLNPDLVAALALDPSYPELFDHAFGDPAITAERIGFALATYQRTLHPDQTPWDRYQNGNTGALNSQERNGLNLFMSNGLRCSQCHTPPLFSDGSYRNIGMRDIAEDNGRQGVTGNFSDRGKFKVPTLRNAGLRTRYFHHGDPNWNNLFLAVFIYNQGAGPFGDNKDPILNNVFFSPGTASTIEAFINGGLTDPRVAAELPPFDRPLLRSEMGPAASLVGNGRAGAGGNEPQMMAFSPPKVGNGQFRVAVSEALGGAPAILALRNQPPGAGGGGSIGGIISRSPSRVAFRTQLSGVGAGQGFGTWNSEIPNDPALVGTQFWMQWLVRDQAAAGGVARSKWAEVTVY